MVVLNHMSSSTCVTPARAPLLPPPSAFFDARCRIVGKSTAAAAATLTDDASSASGGVGGGVARALSDAARSVAGPISSTPIA